MVRRQDKKGFGGRLARFEKIEKLDNKKSGVGQDWGELARFE